MRKRIVTMMVLSAFQWVQVPTAEAFWIKTANGKCLDVRGGNFSNRTLLQTYACNNTQAQQFWFPNDFSSSSRPHNAALAAFKGGKTWCIDMPFLDSHPVWIFDCWGGSNQQWEIFNAWLQIENRNLYVRTPPPGNSQWVPTGTASSGVAYLTYSRANELRLPDGRCLDVPWSTADHTRVVAYQCHGGANQKWYPGDKGIVGLGGMCLTASSETSGYLEIRRCTGLTGQKFRFGGRIRGEANRCLTTQSPNPQDWQYVYPRACDWSQEQFWSIALFEAPYL